MKPRCLSHPKFKALCRRLNLQPWQGRGLLDSIWDWCQDHAVQGDIGKWPNHYIADGINYSGDADELIAVLLDIGWLDQVEGPARLVVHDLQDHAGRFWRERLEYLGLNWWDGSPPRKYHLRDGGGDSGKTHEVLRKNDGETTDNVPMNCAQTKPHLSLPLPLPLSLSLTHKENTNVIDEQFRQALSHWNELAQKKGAGGQHLLVECRVPERAKHMRARIKEAGLGKVLQVIDYMAWARASDPFWSKSENRKFATAAIVFAPTKWEGRLAAAEDWKNGHARSVKRRGKIGENPETPPFAGDPGWV